MPLKSKKVILICLILVNFFLLIHILGVTLVLPQSSEKIRSEGEGFTRKLSYDLQYYLRNVNNTESLPIRVIVVFNSWNEKNSGHSQIFSLSNKIQLLQEWMIIPAITISLPPLFLKDIAMLSEVRSLWLDRSFSVSNFLGIQPDLMQITPITSPFVDTPLHKKNNDEFTQIYNGSNVIVAVLDTGVDFSHDDLQSSILLFGGVSMVDIEPTPFDFHGHGTFIAGVITGDGNKNASFSGIAPGAAILNVKVLTKLGIGYWSWIISGIEYATLHGADIIAMCFSIPGYPNDPVQLAIDAAINRGMIVIAAAGDDGPAFSSVGAPGMAQSVITVGAYNEFNHEVASFSSRGPTLTLHSKPDIIAPGVNITSCRPIYNFSNLFSFDYRANFSELIQPLQSASTYGISHSNYYTTVNSTSAAAAYVTGMVASLLQHAKFLTHEEIKLILQRTATVLPDVSPNVQGAGLVNLSNAHHFLEINDLNDSLVETRLYTPNLFSTWSVKSQNSSRNSTLIVTSYGTLSLMLESHQNYNFMHWLQAQLAIKYNNQFKYFSEMFILRELHNLSADFSIVQSVLTDHTALYVLTIEGFPFTSGFRLNITVINIGTNHINNLTLFSIWNPDLFWNSSSDSTGDSGNYSVPDDILYIFDSDNGNTTYLGFTGESPSHAYEINELSSINTQARSGSLQNTTNYTGNHTAIAMEWFLKSELNASQFHQFSIYIGLGNTYIALNASINAIKNSQNDLSITNLALLTANLPRLGFAGKSYLTNTLLINLGNTAVNNTFASFLINSTDRQTQTFFAKYFDLGRLEPFEFRLVNATWNPTDVNIYSAYWVVGTEALINEIILYLLNISVDISEDRNFLDNFYTRNIFIKNDIFQIHDIFPKNLPIAPQLVYFPNNFALFNLSITTNHPLTNLKIQTLNTNVPADWISCSLPSTIDHIGSLQLTLTIPRFPEIGEFFIIFNITAENYHIGIVTVNFSVRYPSGRILFYKPDNILNFQSIDELENLFSIWNERLDTIYGAYFELFNLCVQNNYAIDDFGIYTQILPNVSLDTVISFPFELPFQTATLQPNFTFISTYDLIILFDAKRNLTQGEIDALIDFAINNGSLFIWVEPEFESEHASINSILLPFGVQIASSYNFNTVLALLDPDNHEITMNLTQIELDSFVSFTNTTNVNIFSVYNDEPIFLSTGVSNKILCIGDSRLFSDSSLYSSDNLYLLNNSLNWLLKDKINITLQLNHDFADPLRIGEHLSLSVHITSIYGTALSENLTLYTYLITPSKRILFMIFFPVQDGWYNSIYLGSWLNETGPHFLVVYANSPAHISCYETQNLTVFAAKLPPEDPALNRDWANNRRILFGALIALAITNIIMGIFFYQRLQWRRKMTIVELKEKIKRDISNLLSEYHLYVKELEDILQKPIILEPDKLRMVLDKQDRKKDLLTKLKKLGKNL